MRATTCFLPITVFSRPSIATILLSFLCLVSNAAFGQTSTWSGGAGNWAPCPPQGNALWNTCPTYPDGKFNA